MGKNFGREKPLTNDDLCVTTAVAVKTKQNFDNRRDDCVGTAVVVRFTSRAQFKIKKKKKSAQKSDSQTTAYRSVEVTTSVSPSDFQVVFIDALKRFSYFFNNRHRYP